MTTFCTNTKNDILKNADSINNALFKALQKLGPNDNKYLAFYSVFANEDLLPQACAIDIDTIYAFDGTTYTLKLQNNITINYNIFYQFWSNAGKVENFAQKFVTIYDGFNTSTTVKNGITIINMYERTNTLIMILFYNFFCVLPNGTSVLPDLAPNNPMAAMVDNFRKFLVLARGTGSNLNCQFCINDYFIPKVGDKKDQAGAVVRKIMSNDPVLRKWCGCCVPQEKNSPAGYNFLNPFTQDNLKYPLYCEPICNVTNDNVVAFSNNVNTIPLITGDSSVVNSPIDTTVNNLSYTIPRCNSTVCIIDDININTIALRGEPITFNQVCPGCNSGNSCICYSYGQGVYDKINAGNDGGMTNPVIFKQNCPNAFCYAEQADGSYQEVKCNSASPANTGKSDISNYEGGGVFTNFQEADIYGVDTLLFTIYLKKIFIIFFLGAIFTTLYRNRVEPRKKHDN